jgi:hypothetical protein
MAAIIFTEATKAYPRTIAPAGKYPIVGDRIYATLQDAQDYVDGKSSSKSAIPGIYLSVIADGDNNGAYWVAQAAGYDGAEKGVLQKMGEGGGSSGGGGGEVTFSLASNTTNAVALTINGTTKNITAATLKTSLGLKALAYKASLAFSEITNKPTTLAGYGITEIVADKVTSDMFTGPTPSGATYPRFRLFQDANYLYLQAATYDGLSTGGKVTIGGMYNSNLEELRLMSDKVGIKKSPTYELDVDGQINSTNYMVGGYLNSDPTNSFQTTFFGGVDSSIFKMRLMRKGTATDGINSPYSPIFAMKTSDTHSFISISYDTKDKCYIGGGSGDKINWSAVLFHHNMDLIPKYNNTYILGNSSFRWKEVHAVSIKIGDATITWDASAGMLKADKGIYSTADIVAGK